MENKLFVVIIVIAVIFLGLSILLIRLDRKLTRIEKEQNRNAPKKV
jgi:preprotein translocase subunit SecG